MAMTAVLGSGCSTNRHAARESTEEEPATSAPATMEPAAAETPRHETLTERDAKTESAAPLPGSPEYKAERIRDLEQNLRPLTPIPTPTTQTTASSRRSADARPSISLLR
jgi:hypothetical protein